MTAYLGPAGNLVEFACPSDEQITIADRVKTRLTFAGVQKAQYSRRSPRAWQVSVGTATPDQIAQLQGLLAGLHGPPPWVYVGPWAQITNLLTPAASILLPGSWSGAGAAAGAVPLEGGVHPGRSINIPTAERTFLPPVPATPGQAVTGSVWGAGDSGFTVDLLFRDAAGATLRIASAEVVAPLGAPLIRGSVTREAPAGAVDVQLRWVGAKRAALPAVTWTPDMAAWAVGGGVPKVVARGLSEAVQLAVRDDRHLRRSSLSFVLEEVGNA